VPAADLCQPPCPSDQFRRCRQVVEGGAWTRVGQQPAVEDAADHHRHPALGAGGQQLPQGPLVEQAVAAGDQHHVEVEVADEAGQHLRLVHAGPDRPHHALVAQLGQGREGVLVGLALVVVGIVQEGDVDPVQAEPLQALLQRAAHAVAGEVPDALARRGHVPLRVGGLARR